MRKNRLVKNIKFSFKLIPMLTQSLSFLFADYLFESIFKLLPLFYVFLICFVSNFLLLVCFYFLMILAEFSSSFYLLDNWEVLFLFNLIYKDLLLFADAIGTRLFGLKWDIVVETDFEFSKLCYNLWRIRLTDLYFWFSLIGFSRSNVLIEYFFVNKSLESDNIFYPYFLVFYTFFDQCIIELSTFFW